MLGHLIAESRSVRSPCALVQNDRCAFAQESHTCRLRSAEAGARAQVGSRSSNFANESEGSTCRFLPSRLPRAVANAPVGVRQ